MNIQFKARTYSESQLLQNIRENEKRILEAQNIANDLSRENTFLRAALNNRRKAKNLIIA